MEKKFLRLVLFIVSVILLNTAIVPVSHAASMILDKKELNHIGSLSLPDAEKVLNDEISAIEEILNYIEGLNQIKLGFAPVIKSDDEPESNSWYQDAFALLTTEEINNQLDENKNVSLLFNQHISDTDSHINIEAYKLEKLLSRAVAENHHVDIKYKVIKIYFKDGSELDNPTISTEDDGFFRGRFILQETKPIEKMDIEIHYLSSPSYQKIVLDREHPVFKQNSNEIYRLTDIQNKEVSLQFFMPASKNYYVEGIAASGKAIHIGSRNSYTVSVEGDMAVLQYYHKALLETKRNFKQFKSGKDLQNHLENITKNSPKSDIELKNVQTDIYFRTTPQTVNLYLIDKEVNSNVVRTFTNNIAFAEFYPAVNNTSQKMGLIDKTGAWVVAPQFDRIQITPAENIYRVKAEDESDSEYSRDIYQYYFMQPGTKTLQLLSFDSLREQLSDELFLVQRETNGPYGIYNVKTNQFVIPMKFVNWKVVDNVFIASLGERTYDYEPQYGVYSLEGKEILAPKYKDIKEFDGFLYVEGKYRQVFTLNGKKLTPDGYNALGYFSQNQPILLQQVKNKKYSFVDIKGKQLKFSLPYDEVKPFSNGMAIVTKEDKKGAINLSGKLTVPIIYRKLYDFQENFAAGESGIVGEPTGLFLIDKNNNKIKKLGQSVSVSWKVNANKAEYHILNYGKIGYITVFDADGNIISTYESKY